MRRSARARGRRLCYLGWMDQEPIETDYELLTPRVWRFNWSLAFWWAVYVAGFAGACYQSEDRGERIVYVVGAALIAPFWAMVCALGERVSDQEVQLFHRRLTARRGNAKASQAVRLEQE